MRFKTWLIINEALDNSQMTTIQGYVRKNYPNLSQQELESILNKFQEDPNPTPTNAVFQTLVNKFGKVEKEKLDVSFAENLYKELGIQPINNELRAIQYFKNENIESLKEIARELNTLINGKKISLEFEKGVPVLVSGNQKTKTIDFRTFTTKLHEIIAATMDYDPNKADPQELAETYKDELVARSSDGKIMVFRAKDPIQCRAMGKGQRWCISSSSSVQWYFNYRHDYGQTQYFIFDFNKSKGDPARYVNPGVATDGRYSEWVDARNEALQVNENLSFSINGYKTLEDYLKYLESNGIGRKTFIATPIEQHEIDLKKYVDYYNNNDVRINQIVKLAENIPNFLDYFLKIVHLKSIDYDFLDEKQKKYYLENINDDGVNYLLEGSKNKDKTAKEIIKYKKFEEVSDGQNIVYFLINHAENKDEIASLIIKKKKNLTGFEITELISNTFDKEKTASLIGHEKINNLSSFDITDIIIRMDDAKRAIELIGKDNLSRVEDEDFEELLYSNRYKKNFSKLIIDNKKELTEKNIGLLVNSHPEYSSEIAEYIIEKGNYKKSSRSIYYLLKKSNDVSKSSEKLGVENINILNGEDVERLLSFVRSNKDFDAFFEMSKALGKNNIDKLSRDDIATLIVHEDPFSEDLEKIIVVLGSYNINKLNKEDIYKIYYSRYDQGRKNFVELLRKYGNEKLKRIIDEFEKGSFEDTLENPFQ
jgi:hypothetical protein